MDWIRLRKRWRATALQKEHLENRACGTRGETQERPETHAQQRRMGHPARTKGYFAGRFMGRMKLLPIR